MISKKEMIKTIEANGLRIDEDSTTILGYYDCLCVVFYNKITKTAAVWHDGEAIDAYTGFGFNVDYGMIEPVKTKIANFIRLLKKKELKERKMEIVSACEGFEV